MLTYWPRHSASLSPACPCADLVLRFDCDLSFLFRRLKAHCVQHLDRRLESCHLTLQRGIVTVERTKLAIRRFQQVLQDGGERSQCCESISTSLHLQLLHCSNDRLQRRTMLSTSCFTISIQLCLCLFTLLSQALTFLAQLQILLLLPRQEHTNMSIHRAPHEHMYWHRVT